MACRQRRRRRRGSSATSSQHGSTSARVRISTATLETFMPGSNLAGDHTYVRVRQKREKIGCIPCHLASLPAYISWIVAMCPISPIHLQALSSVVGRPHARMRRIAAGGHVLYIKGLFAQTMCASSSRFFFRKNKTTPRRSRRTHSTREAVVAPIRPEVRDGCMGRSIVRIERLPRSTHRSVDPSTECRFVRRRVRAHSMWNGDAPAGARIGSQRASDVHALHRTPLVYLQGQAAQAGLGRGTHAINRHVVWMCTRTRDLDQVLTARAGPAGRALLVPPLTHDRQAPS
jgi:hypothetical protein